MSRAGQRILQSLKDIQAKKYRTIVFTEDGTVIITDAETGKSASGRSLADARSAFEKELAA